MARFAVPGCGRIGRMHARNRADHPRVERVSVFDIGPAARSEVAAALHGHACHSADAARESPRGGCSGQLG